MIRFYYSCLLFFMGIVALQAQSKPNVVIFMVDDMGWQDTSLPFADSTTQLNKRYRTPNMERLSRKGITFTNAYAQPVCTPTRASLMTGTNVTQHHISNWTHVLPNTHTDHPDQVLEKVAWNLNGIDPTGKTPNTFMATPLPEILKQNGYYTINVGKAHFAPYQTPASNPLNMGFLRNVAGTAAGHPGSYFGEKNYSSNKTDTLWAVRNLEKYHGTNTFLTEALTQEALQELQLPIRDKKPFFLYLSHYAIHTPISGDPRFLQQYIDVGLPQVEANYASLIEGMDKSLGDLLDFLETEQILGNTIFIFMSDNGGLSLSPPRANRAHIQNLPLRMGKGSVYEGGIRIPFIVSLPQFKNKGQRITQPIIVEDIFPTILELTGIRTNYLKQVVGGKSFSRVLKNPMRVQNNRALIWHYPHNWTNVDAQGVAWGSAIRKGDWKLLYFHKTQQIELYNLRQDIGETQNLVQREKRKAQQLAKELSDVLRQRNAPLPIIKATQQRILYPDEVLKGQQ